MNIDLKCFDLKQIADSGQCFRWKSLSDGTYVIPTKDRVLHVKKEENGFSFDVDEKEWEQVFAPYFDLDTDYEKLGRVIMESGDEHLKACYGAGAGIRILRQDLFETIISFLISQNNNIPRIKKSIEAICEYANMPYENDSCFYRFPGPFDIDPDVFLTENFGLGYRNTYLREMYLFVRNNPDWLDFLKTLNYEEARAELRKRLGIGPKVADCICLFSLHHIDAFPIDTHVKQLLKAYYSEGFPYEKYAGFLGIVQQYLFFDHLGTGA